MATHAMWEVIHEPIPKGTIICHTCDVPACVRPDHLFIGTQADNMRDMRNKNREAWGEKHGHAKLTVEIVLDIRATWESGTMTQRDLAKKYGVHFGTINDIIHRRIWTKI